jgi:hypothetical protein
VAPARFLNLDEANRRFHPALVARFAAGLTESDQHGDAIVDTCAAMPGGSGRQAVHAWLEGTGEVPTELAELLDPLADVPSWVDWERIDRGCVALWRGGAWTGLAFNCASLAAGYRSAAAVKPLMFTGRLVQMAYRRAQETGRWMLAATSPGGLRRDCEGFKETVRVRIIHASVRRRILARGDWRADEWGAPINLTDTAYGIAGEFSTIPLAAMRDAGLHYTEDERDDIQHLWRYVGHLLGVPHQLLPACEAEALEIMRLKELTDTPPDEDSRVLVRALIEHGTPPDLIMPKSLVRVLGPAVPLTLYGFTRRWAGDSIADQLGLPDNALKHVVPLVRPGVRLSERSRRAGWRDERRMAERALSRFRGVLAAGGAPKLVSLEDAGRNVPAAAA